MRKVSLLQILVLILCLCVTGALGYWKPEGRIAKPDRSLQTSLSSLDSWSAIGKSFLSPIIVEELKLDDYVFQTFSNHEDTVTLYVGYYYSGKKVGAAHDPQVCYPGQGWKLSDKQQLSHRLNTDQELNYSRITAELDAKKEEIFYWFQVDDQSASNTFRQKLLLFEKKLLREGEGNAFIRISTSTNDKSKKEAHGLLIDFIEEFYPVLLRHITSG